MNWSQWFKQSITVVGATVAIIGFLSNKIETTIETHLTKDHMGLYKPQFPGDTVNLQLQKIREERKQEIQEQAAKLEKKIDELITSQNTANNALVSVQTELRMLREGRGIYDR